MAKLNLDLKPWIVPNFVQVRNVPDTTSMSMSVKQLPAGTLSDLCDDFRRGVFKKAGAVDPRLCPCAPKVELIDIASAGGAGG